LVWDAVGQPVRRLRFSEVVDGVPDVVVDVDYVPATRSVVALHDSGAVAVWSADTWEQVHRYELDDAGDLDTRPNTAQVVLAARKAGTEGLPRERTGGKLIFLDTRAGSRNELPIPSRPYRVAWSPDGARFATTDGDGRIRLYGDRAAEIWRTEALNGVASGLTYSPDGKLIAVTLLDGEVQVLDAGTGLQAMPPLRDANGLRTVDAAFDSSGTLLAVTTGRFDGSFTRVRRTAFWTVDPDQWQKQICSLAGRDITATEWRTYVGDDIERGSLCPA
jgi:WD40 repeat protein